MPTRSRKREAEDRNRWFQNGTEPPILCAPEACRESKMNHDQIIGEVRAIRERLAAERGYDIRALYEEAKRRQQESDREIVELEPRRLAEVEHGSTGER